MYLEKGQNLQFHKFRVRFTIQTMSAMAGLTSFNSPSLRSLIFRAKPSVTSMLLCSFLVLAAHLRGSAALFKDQAGKWDWRQAYIGRAKFIESDATQSGIKRVFVATHDNAVAAVNARCGFFLTGELVSGCVRRERYRTLVYM